MKIVVTGGRDYYDSALIDETLDALKPKYVYVGDCPTGVDAIVRDWCECTKTPMKIFEADWDNLGKKAGPIRNGLMLTEAGYDALVIAFKGGKGTKSCVDQAISLNMIVMRVEP